jgi:hypothetical protein
MAAVLINTTLRNSGIPGKLPEKTRQKLIEKKLNIEIKY